MFAAESLECGGAFPNLAHAAIFYIFERDAGNDLRGVAGKRIPAWRDQHQLAAPATHAGLGIFCVVIGDDVFDANPAFQPLLFAFDDGNGMIQLFACRQKIFAVVGEFDARRTGRLREGHHFFELIDVATVDDKIERNGDAMLPEPIEDAELLSVGLGAGNFVGGLFARTLKAELDVIETGCYQSGELRFIQGQTRGDEIDVQARRARGTHEFDDIRADERFAAGKIGLKDTGFGGFFEDAGPDFGGELVGAGLHFERIGTVYAMKGAAVGEFCDECQRIGNCRRHSQRKCAPDPIGTASNSKDAGKDAALQLEVEGALFLKQLQISENILLDFLRLRLGID